MATWVDPAVIRAGVASGLPGIGVGGFGTDVADDLEYLRDRVDAIGIGSAQGIHDDFACDTLDTTSGGAADVEPYTWEVGTGGSTSHVTDGAPDHWCHIFNTAGSNWCVIAASPYKMRFDLDRDHTLYGEMRIKRGATPDSGAVWLFGFQDASLAVTAATCVTTQTNIIGFVQDATQDKFDAIVSKSAGSGTLVVANSVGDISAWTVLRIEITFAGATKKVEFFIDGSSVGSTTNTAYIPLVKMRPLIGFDPSATRDLYIDYADFDWTVRPLST